MEINRRLITFDWLLKLKAMKKTKQPLPQGWQMDVENYLTMKRETMDKWLAEYNRVFATWKQAKEIVGELFEN